MFPLFNRSSMRTSERQGGKSEFSSENAPASDSLDAFLTGRWSLNQFMRALVRAHADVSDDNSGKGSGVSSGNDVGNDVGEVPKYATEQLTVASEPRVLQQLTDAPLLVFNSELEHDGFLFQVAHTVNQLFSDGSMYRGTDVFDTTNDIRASRAASPHQWFEWQQGEDGGYQFRESGQAWNSLAGDLVVNTDTENLGSYSATSAGGNPLFGLVFTKRKRFSLLPDNRFSASKAELTSSDGWTPDTSSHTATTQSTTAYNTVSHGGSSQFTQWSGSSEAPDGNLQGNYLIDGNYIQLTTDSGQTIRKLFLQTPSGIFIGDTQYVKNPEAMD